MDFLTALLFPRTHAPIALTRELLLFFDRVVAYQASEASPLPGDLIAAGLLRSYVPKPFGEDLERFERLLRDLKAHKDEYAGALNSALAVSGGRAAAPPVWSLAARLRQGSTISDDDRRFWSARTYLRLAEILDEEEEEIAQGLNEAACREAAIFRSLNGETEKTVTPPPHPLAGAASGPRTEERLKWWAHLFAADGRAERPDLLVTDSVAAWETLADSYEQLHSARPLSLLTLSLPQLASLDTAGYQELRTKLQVELGGLRDAIASQLAAAAKSRTESVKLDACKTWEDAMARFSRENGRGAISFGKLCFTLFDGVSAEDLLRHSINLPRTGRAEPEAGAILAVVRGE